MGDDELRDEILAGRALARAAVKWLHTPDGSADAMLVEAIEALPKRMRCTCGSGGHPRICYEHPGAYERHVAELNESDEVGRG